MKHPFSHYGINTMFFPEMAKSGSDPGIEVCIDDDDDELSEDRRGIIHIYSTLEIRISDDKSTMIQRLTPEEAKCLAYKLNQFASFVESFNEEIEVPVSDLEDFA